MGSVVRSHCVEVGLEVGCAHGVQKLDEIHNLRVVATLSVFISVLVATRQWSLTVPHSPITTCSGFGYMQGTQFAKNKIIASTKVT